MMRLRRILQFHSAAAVALCALATGAYARDLAVHGARLTMRANDAAARRTTTLILRDPRIAPSLSDPRTGGGLVFSAGAAPGQCHVEVTLDPTKWQPIGGDGPGRGYRYLDDTSGSRGVRRIVLRPGEISLRARGSDWPCSLTAAGQRLPVSVELRTSGVRYCAAFGGVLGHNELGRFHARDAAAPLACPKTDLTVADLNILHGLFCPSRTYCRLSDRIDLFFQWIARAGCPDVVTLQEIAGQSPVLGLIRAHLATACPFPYEQVYVRTTIGTDDEMILSRYPVANHETRLLHGGFRTVAYARIDHPIGPVDVFSTHLASSSDGAQNPCTAPSCPAQCVTTGAATVRDCQAVQIVGFITERHDVSTPAVVTGDFNESPGTFAYNELVGRGWTDTYLAAGNPECNPETGIGCTSGRNDEDLSHLESPASNETERIDYIFLIPPAADSLCNTSIDSATDADGDGTATSIFAGDANPFAPPCGPAPAAICWPSDHEGMQLDLNCSPTQQ